MISERFGGAKPNPISVLKNAIRESVFLGDSFSRYGLRDHRSKGNRDHRGNALNSSACTEIIGDCPQPDQFGRQGAHLTVGLSPAGPLPGPDIIGLSPYVLHRADS